MCTLPLSLRFCWLLHDLPQCRRKVGEDWGIAARATNFCELRVPLPGMCACSAHPKYNKSCCAAQHASCNAHRSAHRNISRTLVHTLGASGDRVLLVLLLPEKRADGLAISAEELKSMRARCLRHKTRGRTPAESVQSAPPRLLLPRRGKDAARARHRFL